MDSRELAEAPTAELAEAICGMHALMTAAHANLLQLVAAFDAQEAWREDGCLTMPPGCAPGCRSRCAPPGTGWPPPMPWSSFR